MTVEVHLVCSSCKKEFRRSIDDKDPACWTTVQEWMKEKEPKCEGCSALWYGNMATSSFSLETFKRAIESLKVKEGEKYVDMRWKEARDRYGKN